jgi:hypothetical protein
MAGYVKVYIISPSVIYGIATGELVEQGIQNPHSITVPWVTRVALDRGRSGLVGAGVNVWPNVDIQEGNSPIIAWNLNVNMVLKVADLYVLLYDSIVSNPATGHGREGIYFGENGEHIYYDIAKAIGEVLTEIGKLDNPEPTMLTQEEIVKYFGVSSHAESRFDAYLMWKIPGFEAHRYKLSCSGE